MRRAKEEGEALAIGHPHPATLDVLERELRNLPAKGVRLVRVRDLVR
ncbi:MAG TPA: divergent polysaccharide deacetylase family protein [Thermoanaerobaculia bacterium]